MSDKDEDKPTVKHNPEINIYITFKNISYAAFIGILGWLGVGGDGFTEHFEEGARFNEQYVIKIDNRIKGLRSDVDEMQGIFTTHMVDENLEIIEETVENANKKDN